jgi:hypothetical protein
VKTGLLLIFTLISLCLGAQDKLVLLDGSQKDGRILEITPEAVIMNENGKETETLKELIYFIRLGNGSVDVFNRPRTDVTVYKNEDPRLPRPKTNTVSTDNTFAINTLALVNADLSGFYERLIWEKRVGLGVMGAYNFNRNSLIYTPFISILANAKKTFDLGASVNFYFSPLGSQAKSFYVGILVKHTAFRFTRLIYDTVSSGGQVSGNIRYLPAEGSQLATMITLGRHHQINQNFFVRTIYALGGFRVKGHYREQLETILTPASTPGNDPVRISFLPKMYFGVQAGFVF